MKNGFAHRERKIAFADFQNRLNDFKANVIIRVTDCNGRAAKVNQTSLKKYLGFVKGLIAALVLKEEFEGQLDYPISTGYIKFVAVRKKYRRQGIATTMIKESMWLTNYQNFILDVTEVNSSAIQCYTNIGFKVFDRIPEKHSKQKGFHEKLYMRYCCK